MLTKRKKIAKTLRKLHLAIHKPVKRKTKTPLFIFGCPRSGTNMLTFTIAKDKRIELYLYTDEEAFSDFRLKNKKTIDRLIDKSNAQLIVFKSILNSQNAKEILETYPNSKAIWIYRNYKDVVNSMIIQFPDDKPIEEIIEGKQSWKTEKISIKDRNELKKICNTKLNEHEKRSLFWIIRNNLLYKDKIEKSSKLFLTEYEELVNNPKKEMERIFNFLGLTFNPRITKEIHTRSIKKNKFPKIKEEIRRECEKLMEKLKKTRAKKLKDE